MLHCCGCRAEGWVAERSFVCLGSQDSLGRFGALHHMSGTLPPVQGGAWHSHVLLLLRAQSVKVLQKSNQKYLL